MCVLFVTAPLASPSRAQTPVVVSETEAAQHVGQDVSVEGVVTAVSTSRKGNTFINFGGAYPNQTFTGWIPAGYWHFYTDTAGEEDQDHRKNSALSR
jgi:hypothetical protein